MRPYALTSYAVLLALFVPVATVCAQALPAPAPVAPASPEVQVELKRLRSAVIVAIPRDAIWKSFTYTDKNTTIGRTNAAGNGVSVHPTVEFGGFLLGLDQANYRLVDDRGIERTLPKDAVQIADQTLAQAVQAVLATPAAPVNGAGDGRDAGPSLRIAPITPLMLAAWLDERGDAAGSASLLATALAGGAKLQDAFAAARAGISAYYTADLFDAYQRHDYAQTIRIAKHLAGDAFDDSPAKKQSDELAAQLTTRGMDFKALTLPTEQEWKNLNLGRPMKIAYLGSRLGLLTLNVNARGGRIFLNEQQHLLNETGERVRVINPYAELLAMKPEIAEVTPLVSHLLDRTFMILGTPREGALGPCAVLKIPRVGEAMADVINQAAGQTLVSHPLLRQWPPDAAPLVALGDFDPADRESARAANDSLTKLTAWIRDHSGATREQRLLEVLRTTTSVADFDKAAEELAVLKNPAAAEVIRKRCDELQGTDTYQTVQIKAYLAMLLYHLDPAGTVTLARTWLGHDDYHLRFWAAMILVHGGDKEKGEGWPELLAILKEHDNNQYVPHAFDELLASKRADARAAAVAELKNPEIMDYVQPEEYVRRVILAGMKEGLDYQLAALDDQTAGRANMIKADLAASAMNNWRTDNYRYNSQAPADRRAAERAKLKQWLIDQFALIQAGKPSAIAPPTTPLRSVQWNFPPDN